MVANVFGRIYALKSKLNIQNRISSLGRSIQRLTKNITRSEKQLNAQKRAAINQAKAENNSIWSQQAITNTLLAINPEYNVIFDKNNPGHLDFQACSTESGKGMLAAYQQSLTQGSQFGQQDLNYILAQIEDEFDYQYEVQIEAMKDEQVDMETEKAGLEAQLKSAEAMEQQEKQFADANLKNMFENRG